MNATSVFSSILQKYYMAESRRRAAVGAEAAKDA